MAEEIKDNYGVSVIIKRRRTGRLSMRATKAGEIHVSAPYGLPKYFIDKFIRDHSDWMRTAVRRTAEASAKRESFYRRLPLEDRKSRAEARLRLDAVIAPLVGKYAPMMGVSPASISYTSAKTRWGSCSTASGRIHFSLYLLLLPQWCIEHVVVHELAHLIVPNHSPAFYALMDRYFPQWKAARAETRRFSREGGSMGE